MELDYQVNRLSGYQVVNNGIELSD